MRFTQLFTTYIALVASAVDAVSIRERSAHALDTLEANIARPRSEVLAPENALHKRKGGGGKGGGGGSGSKSGSGSGGSSGRTGSGSSAGGSTKSGSGAARSYGGGYYGGGAAVPYTAGSKTPKGLIAGALILPAAALAFFPGIWLWSVYPYYLNEYRFYNSSFRNATQNGLNQTLPVTCLCQEYSVCGCDDNDNTQYLNDLVGNGSYDALNKSLVTVGTVNNTQSLVINGTLPNGTTAPGGTDDAAAGLRVGYWSGYLVMATIVFSAVSLL